MIRGFTRIGVYSFRRYAVCGIGKQIEINFEDLASPKKDRLIIDIRREEELHETGKMENSVFLPSLFFRNRYLAS